MPKGRPENLLRPSVDQTAEERRRSASAAGTASGVARRRKKALREFAECFGELPVSGKEADGLRKLGLNPEELNQNAMVVFALFKQAKNGSIRAFEQWASLLDSGAKNEDEGVLPALLAELAKNGKGGGDGE